MLAISGECADEILCEVQVESVEPMGSPSQLLVSIILSQGAAVPPPEVVARLNERAGKLRASLATAINRKRVPMLSFVVVPAQLREQEEGGG